MEQAQRFPKSSWYREDLVPLLGTYITLECGNYEIEKYSGRANKAVLRNSRVKHINKSALKNTKVPDIEHLWALLNPALIIDKQKPLKLTGVVCFSGTMRIAILILGFRGVNSEYALCISLSSSFLIDSFPTFLKK